MSDYEHKEIRLNNPPAGQMICTDDCPACAYQDGRNSATDDIVEYVKTIDAHVAQDIESFMLRDKDQ